jgi:hypothetical protein
MSDDENKVDGVQIPEGEEGVEKVKPETEATEETPAE